MKNQLTNLNRVKNGNGGDAVDTPPGSPLPGQGSHHPAAVDISIAIIHTDPILRTVGPSQGEVPHPYTGILLVTQSHMTVCDPMDCSLPGSSVHKSLLERILEWNTGRFPSSGDIPDPGIESRSPTLQTDPLLSEPPVKSYM